MTKLEELKAAADAASDAYDAAEDTYASAAYAYQAELKKTQKEKQDV
jgi:hypothetical protein